MDSFVGIPSNFLKQLIREGKEEKERKKKKKSVAKENKKKQRLIKRESVCVCVIILKIHHRQQCQFIAELLQVLFS